MQPHSRQWCLRKKNVNSVLHKAHVFSSRDVTGALEDPASTSGRAIFGYRAAVLAAAENTAAMAGAAAACVIFAPQKSQNTMEVPVELRCCRWHDPQTRSASLWCWLVSTTSSSVTTGGTGAAVLCNKSGIVESTLPADGGTEAEAADVRVRDGDAARVAEVTVSAVWTGSDMGLIAGHVLSALDREAAEVSTDTDVSWARESINSSASRESQ